MFYLCIFSLALQFSFYRAKLDLHKFARGKYGAKSAKEEEIKDKGSKYRIYIPVYMELHN